MKETWDKTWAAFFFSTSSYSSTEKRSIESSWHSIANVMTWIESYYHHSTSQLKLKSSATKTRFLTHLIDDNLLFCFCTVYNNVEEIVFILPDGSFWLWENHIEPTLLCLTFDWLIYWWTVKWKLVATISTAFNYDIYGAINLGTTNDVNGRKGSINAIPIVHNVPK